MAADDGGVSGRQRLAPEHAWPKHLTSFIGRERELATVRRLLADSRMLTLVGSGGVGKTRPAVSEADGWSLDGEQVVDFVAFMDLASLRDPDLAPETLAARLGVREAAWARGGGHTGRRRPKCGRPASPG